ncbi:alanine racemase [Arthrobacter sp. LAPM80]|uniref:YggS family pyridoxal phosphate enzyme n=1 Tax=Arthrobacter sp. LAPM80 TaxID=3141788 RepID=UPI00398B6AB4
MTLQDPRTSELADRLAAVHRRIDSAAATAAGAKPTLIVVTKFHPAADVLRLRSLGVADVGENRDQEAAAKALEVSDAELRWHFIGQLQTNKAKSVAAYAHSVHSIDRASLVTSLGRAMNARQQENGRANLECFIQVDLSGAYPELSAVEPTGRGGRGGVAPSNIEELADLIAGTGGLELAGLMAVAPLGVAPEPAFDLLARASAALLAQHPQATGFSAGMSQDLEAAIAVGATHLRVGSDILGPRPPVL